MHAMPQIPRIWEDAGKESRADEFKHLNLGVLDCAAALPSGKSTYKRFDVAQEEGLHGFYVANLGKARSLPSTFFTVAKSNAEHARAMLTYVDKSTRIKSKPVKTSNELNKFCLDHARCALVLHNGPLDKPKKQALNLAMDDFRNVRWTTLDTSKLSISIQHALPVCFLCIYLFYNNSCLLNLYSLLRKTQL
jgi:hypothetical protein